MRIITAALLCAAIALCANTITTNNILSKVELIFKEMVRLYQTGDHSDAFSAVMSAKVRLDELHEAMGFPHSAARATSLSCS